MNWQLTLQGLLFLIVVPIFAFNGFRRGWRREIISLLFIIVAFVFFALNGGVEVAKLIYHVLLNQTLSDANLLANHAKFVNVATGIALVAIIAFGYFIGSRLFPRPGLGQDRLLGIIPGVISGILLVVNLTNFFFPDAQRVIEEGTNLVPLNFITDSATLIFVIAVVVIIIGLVAVRTKKSSK